MKLTPKHKRKPHIAPDLSAPEGRKRANSELMWGDHHFLRLRFQNLHQISDEMWRSNQPSPKQIAEHAAERGIKTILNLRGVSTKGYYLLEKEACEANGVELVEFQVYSRDTPKIETVLAAKALFDSISYPALMHCKSGADRAGLASVLYMHFRQGLPIAEAVGQLSKKYLHLREGKTGLLDHFFEEYLAFAETSDIPFEDWVRTKYNPAEMKAEFLASGKGKLRLSELLRRE